MQFFLWGRGLQHAHSNQSLRRFAALNVQLFALLASIYWLVPALRKPLVREDNLLEMATALLFLATIILGTRALLRLPLAQRTWSDWLVPGLALLGFLEEVSFGRLFFDKRPIVEGVKIDAIDDYLRVGLALWESGAYDGLIRSVALSVAAILVAALWVCRRYLLSLAHRLPVQFCAVCMLFVAVASVLDLGLIEHHFLVFLEEYLEMLAAVALWFGYLGLRQKDRLTREKPRFKHPTPVDKPLQSTDGSLPLDTQTH